MFLKVGGVYATRGEDGILLVFGDTGGDGDAEDDCALFLDDVFVSRSTTSIVLSKSVSSALTDAFRQDLNAELNFSNPDNGEVSTLLEDSVGTDKFLDVSAMSGYKEGEVGCPKPELVEGVLGVEEKGDGRDKPISFLY